MKETAKYVNILLRGYFNKTSNKYLDDFLTREYLNSFSLYSIDEYCVGLLDALDNLTNETSPFYYRFKDEIKNFAPNENNKLDLDSLSKLSFEEQINLNNNVIKFNNDEIDYLRNQIESAKGKLYNKDGIILNDTNPIESSESIDQDDFTMTTIKDYLEEFKDNTNRNDYDKLINSLYKYFTEGNFISGSQKINITKKVNKRKIGWAFNQLYRNLKDGPLPYEYILFAKENISIYSEEKLEINTFRKSNLYKYFTSKS